MRIGRLSYTMDNRYNPKTMMWDIPYHRTWKWRCTPKVHNQAAGYYVTWPVILRHFKKRIASKFNWLFYKWETVKMGDLWVTRQVKRF